MGFYKKYMLDHERLAIPWETHDSQGSGHYKGKATTQKLVCVFVG
jgi:hypothetical protein